jgi:two-component system sensor histidine kinase PilS (NtrC family)
MLVAAGLLIAAILPADINLLGLRYPGLFVATAAVYSACALIVALLLRGASWRTDRIAWLQLAVDSLCIPLIAHASGGVSSGIEGLLIVFVATTSMTLAAPRGYLAAAVAAALVLAEQVVSYLDGVTEAAGFLQAGLIAAIMVTLSVALQPLLRRIVETESLARQRGIDLENLAQLNAYVIQTLREAILVIDEQDHIRLTNQAAVEALVQPQLQGGTALKAAAPELYALLQVWRGRSERQRSGTPSFTAPDGATTINAHFAPLGSAGHRGPVLIFLEDASLLAEKVQQSKLAALGRLSASIAHEIRNPVGALSHAAQLLKESPALGAEDSRFIEIIQTNSQRVSGIVDNILQLSRKDTVKPRILELDDWVEHFVREFVSTLELFEGQVSITDRSPVAVRMDPGHLHQVVWNLCENAMKYASETAGAIAVEVSYGRMANSGRPFLEVADHGPGIPAEMADSVFEPFATGRLGGTGLGLYICRELCERNRANLRYRPRESGGSVFQIVFADPARWEASPQ